MLGAVSVAGVAAAQGSRAPAELVVRNARIYTLDSARPWAVARAVRGGRRVFVGTDVGAARWAGPRTRVVDARGRTILPGFHDTHVHLPEQRLTLAEALAAYTVGGAYANFLDRESGSLAVGKWADFVMLDRDLLALEPEAIRHTRVLWTVVEGRDVRRAPASPAPARRGPGARRTGGARPDGRR